LLLPKRGTKYCAFYIDRFVGFLACPWGILQGKKASTHTFLCANGSFGPSDPLSDRLAPWWTTVTSFTTFAGNGLEKGNTMPGLKLKLIIYELITGG